MTEPILTAPSILAADFAARLRGFEGYINRKSFTINPST